MDRVMYLLGKLVGKIGWIFIYALAHHKKARVFHPQGTVCTARIIALDDVVGPRLAGDARVRFSGSAKDENSPEQTIVGMALEMANAEQDLPLATFESFFNHNLGSASAGTDATDVTDYLSKKNEYASVTPWRVDGLGVVWFRALSLAEPVAGAKRTDRLAAHAQARAKLVLQARRGPGKEADVIATIAEIELTGVLPDDRLNFTMRVTRTGRGISPTGFRNGLRSVVYRASQRGRGVHTTG